MRMDDKMSAYGNKVRLASMKLEDIEHMMDWGSHEDDLFDDYNFPYMNREEQAHWFSFKTKGKKRCFSVFEQGGRIIGYISLRHVSSLRKKAEMGIVFDPAIIGRGYGSDALQTFLRWYFRNLGYRKLILHVAAYNKRAIRVYEKAGFHKVSENYGEFLNQVVDPLRDEGRADIRPYFRKKRQGLEVLQYRMEISTLSTS